METVGFRVPFCRYCQFLAELSGQSGGIGIGIDKKNIKKLLKL
jgi:hypothetical protein